MAGTEINFVREAFESNYIAPLGPQVDAFETAFCEYTGFKHCVALTSGTAAMHLALRYLIQQAEGEVRWTRDDRFARTMDERSKMQLLDTQHSTLSTVALRPLVLASTLTFIGSVTPAVFEGCDITFIDCERESWNMDPELLEAELARCEKEGRLPVAVIPTDLYGQCCDLERIVDICDHYGVPVICDSAEAMGAWYESAEYSVLSAEYGENKTEVGNWMSGVRGQRAEGKGQRTEAGVQSLSTQSTLRSRATAEDGHSALSTLPASRWRHAGFGAKAAVFSFNGNKIITTSGGGMLASDDKELIEKARFWSQQARDPFPHYEHTEIGYNYRMSNIAAAIGLGQLQVLNDRVRRKREIFDYYREALRDVPGIAFMPEAEYGRSTRWLTVILIEPEEFGVDREAVRLALETENIESRPVWKPMHLQPVFNPQMTQINADFKGEREGKQKAVSRGQRAEGREQDGEGQRSEVRGQRGRTDGRPSSAVAMLRRVEGTTALLGRWTRGTKSSYSALSTQSTLHSRATAEDWHSAPSYRIVGGGVSEELFEKGLCLPSGTAMGDRDLERGVGTIKALRKR